MASMNLEMSPSTVGPGRKMSEIKSSANEVEGPAHAELIQLIQSRFAEIQVKRPEYSMRAFSRTLGLTASQFSEIIRGKRPVTRKIAIRILDRLDIDPETAGALVEKLPVKQTRRKRAKASLQKQLKIKPSDQGSQQQSKKRVLNYVQLSTDEFRLIADWYYLAILSLAETKNFYGDPVWISKRLGIRERDARSAVDGLIRLGLLERTKSGKLRATGKQFTTTNDIPDSSIRKNHSQGLEQAKEVLDQVPVELREITASIISIDPKLLPKAKERLREIKREITQLLEGGDKKEVYRLGIQLFPLTKEVK